MDAVSNADIIYIIILYRVDEGGQRGIIDRNRERQNHKFVNCNVWLFCDSFLLNLFVSLNYIACYHFKQSY